MFSFIRSGAVLLGAKAVTLMSNPVVAVLGAGIIAIEAIKIGTPVVKRVWGSARDIFTDDEETTVATPGKPAAPADLKVVKKIDEPSTPYEISTLKTLRASAKKYSIALGSKITKKQDIWNALTPVARDYAVSLAAPV